MLPNIKSMTNPAPCSKEVEGFRTTLGDLTYSLAKDTTRSPF